MANYVYNKVVCNNQTLYKYFLDRSSVALYKLFGVNSRDEYKDKYAEPLFIYYTSGYKKRDDGLFEINFSLRWEYPIKAIRKAIELDHNIVWYAVEENCIYVSKFYWFNEIKEDIMILLSRTSR